MLGVDGDHRGSRDNAVGYATTAFAVLQSAAIAIGTPLAPRLRTDTRLAAGDTGSDGSHEWLRHGRRLTYGRGRSDGNRFQADRP